MLTLSFDKAQDKLLSAGCGSISKRSVEILLRKRKVPP